MNINVEKIKQHAQEILDRTSGVYHVCPSCDNIVNEDDLICDLRHSEYGCPYCEYYHHIDDWAVTSGAWNEYLQQIKRNVILILKECGD